MSASEPIHAPTAADFADEPKPTPGGGRPSGKRSKMTALGLGLSIVASVALWLYIRRHRDASLSPSP